MFHMRNFCGAELRNGLNILAATMIGVAMILNYSCAPIIEEETTGTISGIVADKTTGEPIPTVIATLTPGNMSTVTGTDGSFLFKKIEAGNYTLACSKEGYRPDSKTVTVQAGKTVESHMLLERIPAVITCDRDILDFGENASMNTLSFNIVNNNYKDLNYTIIENCGWIVESDPSSGILPYGKTGTIVLKIDRELLTAGVNETVVVVRTEGEGSSELIVQATGVEKRKPSLNVKDATQIKASSAMLNAEITDPGAPEYTERGFVYSESPMPDLDNTIAKMTASVTADLNYSIKLNGLTLGNTYYVRAYAANDLGTTYSTNQITFRTKASLPKVSMGNITNVDIVSKTAILLGSVTDAGDPTYEEKGFVYSVDTRSPTIYDSKVVAAGGNLTGTYDVRVTDLEINRLYYVRAYAKNEAGIAYSDTVIGLSIEEILPVVRTDAATDEDREHNSVVLHGTIVSAGAPPYSERGFVYSDVYESPTIYDNKIIVPGSGSSFEYRSTELTADKVYYVRAYATNSKGTAYGQVIKAYERDWIVLSSCNIAVQKQDIGSGAWSDVSMMCAGSSHEGFNDWRLPTKEELMAMYVYKNDIGNFEDYFYWSSTSGVSYRKYIVNMKDGQSTQDDTYSHITHFARCVRSIDSTK